MRASGKTGWWREDGMAGGAVADRKLSDALNLQKEKHNQIVFKTV